MQVPATNNNSRPQATVMPKQSACSSVKRFGLGAIVACLFSPVSYGIVKLLTPDRPSFEISSQAPVSPDDAEIIKNSICPITELMKVVNRDNTEKMAKSMGLVGSGINTTCYAFPPEVEIPYISVTRTKIERFVGMAIFAPLHEELLFRWGANGIMKAMLDYGKIDQKTSKVVRVVYNVGTFTLSHVPRVWAFSEAAVVGKIITAFIASSGLIMMVEDRRFGLSACIGAHMTHNAIGEVPSLLGC